MGGAAFGEGVGGMISWENIWDRAFKAARLVGPRMANGDAGAGLSRASVRAWAASVAASAEEVLGMGHSCGKKDTVLAMRSALVLGTYTR